MCHRIFSLCYSALKVSVCGVILYAFSRIRTKYGPEFSGNGHFSRRFKQLMKLDRNS